jgi:hypothetical protein
LRIRLSDPLARVAGCAPINDQALVVLGTVRCGVESTRLSDEPSIVVGFVTRFRFPPSPQRRGGEGAKSPPVRTTVTPMGISDLPGDRTWRNVKGLLGHNAIRGLEGGLV